MADDKEKVTLDFEDYRIDEWEFEAGGTKYTIANGGTEVPASRAEAIEQQAKEAGVPLRRL